MKGQLVTWNFTLSSLVCHTNVITMGSDIYHEKQVKELCALHALNNLFQKPDAFTKLQLDEICYSLSPDNFVNPHKSIFGLGNYDVNVLMAALQMKGCEAIWFDKRKDPSCLNLLNIKGFILNVPNEYRLGFIQLPLRRKHWITICDFQGLYYNLDSKLERPELIGKDSDLLNFLREQILSKEKEIFVIVKTEVERSQSWRKDSVDYQNSGVSSPQKASVEVLDDSDSGRGERSSDSQEYVEEERRSSS